MISKIMISKIMFNKVVRVTGTVVFGLSLFALAQAAPAAGAPAGAGTPAASASTAPNAPSAAAALAAKATGTKVGTINIEQAIFASNEGRRDFETLSKKFEPKQNELKGLADELDALQKQLFNAKAHFEVYMGLAQEWDDHILEIQNSPVFWQFTMKAHTDAAVYRSSGDDILRPLPRLQGLARRRARGA